ncbi:MAG: hypothetical protein JJU33_07600 [Phycisphaerales bacterium]|nr:hypothetical protein [Phycisphaerales bacterium]
MPGQRYRQTQSTPVNPALTTDGPGPKGRPFIGVYFQCANRYVRVHRHVDGSSYAARCPSCGKSMTFLVADGGTDQRMFRASC